MADNQLLGITDSLFGVKPKTFESEFAAALPAFKGMSATDIGTAATYAGAKQAGRGLMQMAGIEDPEMASANRAKQIAAQLQQQGVSMQSSQGMKMLAQKLSEAGDFKAAQAAAMLATQFEEDQAGIQLKGAQAAKALRETIPAADEQAARIRLKELQDEFGMVEGAKKYREEQLTGKKSVAAAGVPAPGMVGISDIKGGADIADRYTKEPKTKLEAIGIVGTQLEAVKTNPTLLPQVQRSLVKIVGDSQIGQNEVKNILGSSGFASDVIDGVNKFFTGAPTDAKIDDVLRGVKVMEEYYSKKYSAGREKASRVLSNAKLDPRTVEDLLPSAYRAGAPSLEAFLARARTANPGVSDAELTNYYNNKYRLSK